MNCIHHASAWNWNTGRENITMYFEYFKSKSYLNEKEINKEYHCKFSHWSVTANLAKHLDAVILIREFLFKQLITNNFCDN